MQKINVRPHHVSKKPDINLPPIPENTEVNQKANLRRIKRQHLKYSQICSKLTMPNLMRSPVVPVLIGCYKPRGEE